MCHQRQLPCQFHAPSADIVACVPIAYAVLPITSWKSDRAVVEVISEQCRPQLSAAIGGSSRDVSVKVGSDHYKGSAIAVLRKQASELLRCRPASRSKSAVEYRVHQV